MKEKALATKSTRKGGQFFNNKEEDTEEMDDKDVAVGGK